jgi:pilus assembly protein Flp/PilA
LDLQERIDGDTMIRKSIIGKIWADQSGATAVEYGLIASLIVIAMMAALQSVADENGNKWEQVREAAEEVMGR